MSDDPTRVPRLARMKFRAWHRGTREADYIFGGFFDTYHANWNEAEIVWFEALLDEDDVDVMAWALGTAPAPHRFHGPLLEQLQQIDYVKI